MKNITLGRYLPLNSLIHNLDPRAKILAMLVLIVSIFIDAGFIGYGFLLVFCVMVLLLAKLKISYVYKSMKPMLFMLLFLLLINILVLKTGTVLVDIYGFKIYSDAIFQTLYIVIRLFLMIMITTALTATTKPLDLTLGIEELLTPFKRLGLPAHEIAMMISIALRFIPTLIEETERIMKAQASRGADFQEGNLKEKLRSVVSLIVPLFVSAFQRADDLANAMESRGYVPGAERTRYKLLKWQLRDSLALISSFGALFLIIVMAVFR